MHTLDNIIDLCTWYGAKPCISLVPRRNALARKYFSVRKSITRYVPLAASMAEQGVDLSVKLAICSENGRWPAVISSSAQ